MLSGPAAGAEASGVRQEVGGGQHNDRRGLDVLKKLARDIMSAVGKRLGSYCCYSDIALREMLLRGWTLQADAGANEAAARERVGKRSAPAGCADKMLVTDAAR